MWSDSEKKDHINTLELRAAMLGIQSLCRKLSNCSLRVEMDNTTAVAYINNMGGTHSAACNAITRQILLWCKARGIWLLACHIAGKDNDIADSYSRKQSINTEWSLNREVFSRLCKTFGTPRIDIFAARTNHQLPKYMSLYPDPNAVAINTFFHSWNQYIYIFPPFNLISRILKKLVEDETDKALVVIPNWKTQTWYPKLIKMMVGKPIHLTQRSISS
ncbi:reverse transcriptase [Plakobranchus ocellatus]|uniref:Reverse transcriptase n=1 Tax=Plakobranchus ocellatus TaxID=259542 RepID=A0AAV4CYW5_9GAST|nr:reverse transcriptase [Plakobranchus ocellatus]